MLGPFRVRASVDVRYVDADTFVEATAEPTRDKYLEVQPRVLAAAPVGAGAFDLEYAPVFRAFATYDQVNSSSHLLGAGLELPVGSRVTLRARDRFQSGVLDTRVVDPGGEYFFGLGRFNRNDVDAGMSIVVGPRLSVELAGAAGRVHFLEESNFFDYDTRLASAGLGFELTPNLRATASYVYDTVPRPDERPEAESTAHGARFALNGEILPLLTGQLAVGYRSQDAPNAGPGGQSYSGFTLQAALQRELGRDANFSVYANRSTPVSAFEENAFYVSTGVQGVLKVPLVAKFELRGGLGYQWNDYKTIAAEIGAPARGPHPRLVRGPAAADRPQALALGRLPQGRPDLQHRQLRHRLGRALPPARVGHLRHVPAMIQLLAVTPLLALLAQAAPAPAPAPYRVGPGDVIEVAVDGRPDLSRMPTVQTTGSIWLPRAGDVEVRGLTTAEIAARVAPLLAGADLAAPRVAVRVAEYNSQFVWVMGAVNRPGRKPLRAGTRLVDALLDAGGFVQGASGEVVVLRAAGFEGGAREARFKFGGKDPSADELQRLGLPLAAGDQVTAVLQRWVGVSGAVERPGQYAF